MSGEGEILSSSFLLAGLTIKLTQDSNQRITTNLIHTHGGLMKMGCPEWLKQAVDTPFLDKATIICEDGTKQMGLFWGSKLGRK